MAESVSELIRNNLGERTLQKIECRLLGLFGLSIKESLLEFEKLDIVLRDFSGEGSKGLKKKIIEVTHT